MGFQIGRLHIRNVKHGHPHSPCKIQIFWGAYASLEPSKPLNIIDEKFIWIQNARMKRKGQRVGKYNLIIWCEHKMLTRETSFKQIKKFWPTNST